MSEVDFSSIGKTSQYIANQESATKKSNSSLDQSDFLKLLTTQLSNQDPSSPVDNNQMVGTMSQLSIVDNLSTITKGMDNMVNAIRMALRKCFISIPYYIYYFLKIFRVVPSA